MKKKKFEVIVVIAMMLTLIINTTCVSANDKTNDDYSIPQKIIDIANGSDEIYGEGVPIEHIDPNKPQPKFTSGGIDHTHQYLSLIHIYLVFLGGEPLLNPKMMVKAIEIINTKYADCKDLFHYSITTNGTLLTRDIIDFLIENSFQISISVDGDEETHNLNRKSKNGKSVFPIVMKNIKYLIEKDVDFSVRMTVTKNNVHLFYNNVKFFDDLGVKKIFAAYDEFADWDDKSIYILEEQMNLLDAFYLESIIQDKDKILNLYDYKLTTFIAERTPMFCSAGSKGHITINSRGEIYPCGFVSSDKNWKIGDVKSGLDTAKFKNEIKKHLYDKAKCKGCDIAFTCSGTKCGFKNFATTGYLNLSLIHIYISVLYSGSRCNLRFPRSP